jgi:hypothetical protein
MFSLQPPRYISTLPEAALYFDAAIRPQLEHDPTWRGRRACAAATLVTPCFHFCACCLVAADRIIPRPARRAQAPRSDQRLAVNLAALA